MSPEKIPEALAAQRLVACSIVVRPDGTGEVIYARVSGPRHPGTVHKARYFCDLHLEPTRRTPDCARRPLARARGAA